MADNVVKLEPVEVGDDYRFDPDEILEAAKGQDFSMVVILGQLPDGEIWVSGSANAGESMILLKLAELHIIGK